MLYAIAPLIVVLAAPAAKPAKVPVAVAPTVAAPTVPAPAASTGPALRIILLDPQKPRSVHEIHAAPGLSTTIQLPEAWVGTPVCGDCVFGDQALTTQLWRLDVNEATRSLNVKPTRLPGPDIPPSAFLTNIDLTLEGGISVTLFVKLTLPEEADARVEFQIPQEATSKAKMTQKERELEDAFAVRVTAAANEKMMKALLAGTKCRDFVGRPTREDSLVVRLKQLCRNGALLYVNFEVDNRSRADAQMGSASLTDAGGLTSTLTTFEKLTVRFNERVGGIVGIELADPNLPPSSFTLTVVEDGGKGRTVVVEGIEF